MPLPLVDTEMICCWGAAEPMAPMLAAILGPMLGPMFCPMLGPTLGAVLGPMPEGMLVVMPGPI